MAKGWFTYFHRNTDSDNTDSMAVLSDMNRNSLAHRIFFTFLLAVSIVGSNSLVHAQSETSPKQQPNAGPNTATLTFDRNYLTEADSNVTISEWLTDSLTAFSITSFSTFVEYNQNLLQFVNVLNGAETPLPDWNISYTITTPGVVQLTAESFGAPLQTSGEIVELIFHVVSDAEGYDSSHFVDSDVILSGTATPIFLTLDTGLLRVVDGCVPVVTIGTNPKTDAMELSSNPIFYSATLSYFLTSDSNPRFELFDNIGNLVRTIQIADATMGWNRMPFETSGLSPGMYSLEFLTDDSLQFQQIVILH